MPGWCGCLVWCGVFFVCLGDFGWRFDLVLWFDYFGGFEVWVSYVVCMLAVVVVVRLVLF